MGTTQELQEKCSIVLIFSYWNVNGDNARIAGKMQYRINLFILECKFGNDALLECNYNKY